VLISAFINRLRVSKEASIVSARLFDPLPTQTKPPAPITTPLASIPERKFLRFIFSSRSI